MIVRLVRPTRPADGPWLLLGDGDAQLITPTPDLESLMREPMAWFEAEPIEGGWEIRGRIAGARRRRTPPRCGPHRRLEGWGMLED